MIHHYVLVNTNMDVENDQHLLAIKNLLVFRVLVDFFGSMLAGFTAKVSLNYERL